MFIHRSNRLERLVDALAEVVGDGGGDPMSPETVVVQSQGMARYLSMRLAQRRSVWANPSFPFPRAILEQAFAAVLGAAPGVPEPVALDRDGLQLALATRLPLRLSEPAFQPLARYLRHDAGADKLIQLCARLAQLFDDYTVFRSDWVRDWERGGEPDDWQASAMRALAEEFGAYHVGARSQAFFEALAHHRGPLTGLPNRLSVFGISSLPPLYVRLLSALSQHLPVHLFLLSPTREYWADLRTPREQARLRQRAGGLDERALHLSEGHPLLASFGTLGRELFAVIEGEEAHHDGDFERYEDAGQDTLLRTLQSDMLALRDRQGDPSPVSADDDSLQVHVCHSATREVEVLHDQLAALLEDPGLDPEDIVVMAPDIEVYAPAVEAVFGHGARPQAASETGGRPSIPFRIADRGLLAAHPHLDALLQVVGLLDSRFEAPAVLDVLALAPVRKRFEIAAEDLDTLRTWVDQSGIRWGVDAAHRAELGQPRLAGNTFAFGLERLMLGYAMEGHGHRLFAGRLPFDDIEGSIAVLLGRFAAFCQALFELRARFAGEHSLAEWRLRFSSLLERVLLSDADGEQELQGLRDALDALVADAERTGFNQPIGLSPMRRLLEARLEQRRGAVGFMSGGVTFCQLVPMRSLPFQVVVLLGMDDESFPRTDRPLGFDKRRGAPRLGDRSLRNDDRYLFLEAILSARRKLILSYVGRGIHDNAVRPPSVMLAELLDALDRQFRFAAGSARAQLCIEHRLQPFSPAYFGGEPDSPLFSYASHYFEGARSLQAADVSTRVPFATAPLPEPEDDGPVPLDLLERYASHPIRTFMQVRLGLFMGRDLTPLEARERLLLDPLSRWQVGDALLSLSVGGQGSEGADLAALSRAVLAAGQLPLGVPGEVTYDGLHPGVAAIAHQLSARLGSDRRGRRVPFALHVGALEIEGQLDGVGDSELVAHQFSRVGTRFELALWVRHLVLNALAQQQPELDLPVQTALLGRAKQGDGVMVVHYAPVADAQQALSELLDVLRWARRFPLPFAHGSSRAYAESLAAEGDQVAALTAARKAFEDARFGELRDPYVALAYPDFDALLAPGQLGFATAARSLYAPLLDHRSEELVS